MSPYDISQPGFHITRWGGVGGVTIRNKKISFLASSFGFILYKPRKTPVTSEIGKRNVGRVTGYENIALIIQQDMDGWE